MALFVDLVALSNGLHGSVQMDLVALFSWIGWLRHHGIFSLVNTCILSTQGYTLSVFMMASFVTCLPGIILQLIVIPVLVRSLNKNIYKQPEKVLA